MNQSVIYIIDDCSDNKDTTKMIEDYDIKSMSGVDNFASGKTVFDPACGDGQMLVTVKWLKVLHFGMTEEEALKDIYGVDIMRDNVDLCKKRLGGGTIIMGDTLNPYAILPQQTEQEQILMEDMFGDQMTLKRFMV